MKKILYMFSTIIMICTLFLVGIHINPFSVMFDFRVLRFGTYIDELLKAISSFLLIVSVMMLPKSKIPLQISLCLIVFSEIYSFICLLNINKSVYSYVEDIVIYNCVALVLLTIITIVVIHKKAYYSLLLKASILVAIFYIVVCALPVVLFDSFINLTLIIYYLSTYLFFGFVGKYFMCKDLCN